MVRTSSQVAGIHRPKQPAITSTRKTNMPAFQKKLPAST